jgi:hypothetical protein
MDQAVNLKKKILKLLAEICEAFRASTNAQAELHAKQTEWIGRLVEYYEMTVNYRILKRMPFANEIA